MMILVVLLLVIILIILLSFKSSTSRKLQQLEQELIHLRKEIALPPAATVAEEKKQVPPIIQPEPEEEWASGFKVVTDPSLTSKKEDWLPKEEPEHTSAPEVVYTRQEPLPVKEEQFVVSSKATGNIAPPKPPKPTFFERNPDLEKFIGENLVSKIGIAILVLAIGYFVKFAIDNNWVGAVGRVSIGIVCGGILIGVAHRLRKNYHAFSSVLAGGGLAVLYFTITLAYQQFHLFSQTVAFIILLVITAFAVLLALLYNRQELAVIALVGGFASPFLVSNGSGNYVTLFIYLLILNTGLLIIAYNKTWRILNVTAFLFTVILFSSWLASLPDTTNKSVYANGLLFAAIFYLLFFAINIANNIKERKQFLAFDFGILLLNTCLFFSAGLYCLNKMNATAYNGLFSAVMAVFNLAATYFLFKKNNLDKNILYLLIGITLTFISLTAPLQLHGHFITLFWASEAVLLCWLYIKSNISIVRYASLIVYTAMLISLLMDWVNVYVSFYPVSDNSSLLPVIINRGFITAVYTAAASYLFFFLLHKTNIEKYGDFVPANTFRFIAIALLFIGGIIETNYQFSHRFPFTNIALLYIQLYIFSFVLLLFLITKRFTRFTWSNRFRVAVLAACIMLYFTQLSATVQIQNVLFLKENSAYSYLFAGHWISALLLAIIIYRLTNVTRQNKEKNIAAWLLCGTVVAYLSAEVYLLMNNLLFAHTNAAEIDRVFVKVVLPVLWGLCSFGFMWLGMKHQYKTLRIISLSLFSITLLKLFIYDISNIPIAGKIAAFFCLGVLLLIISFMYQRLKKIIIEDEKKQGA
ncbi:DUF2339 domain-containing protein [Ilyomonas limi]|uniref:DUF2339 domain-containing protein n=1 Tax=Ilyomonas limi TaxID=2575867 RepID=A0A4U3L7E2_9BACT|nr:DUF2339 domain-containing protein [Ilyomonas limi]TKK70314.1 DUF2339 domain-containing protein [Ilyomonas limi]